MAEVEEQIQEEQRPTDEQATAFLNGNVQAVERQEQAPQPKAEAPAPAASTPQAPIEKTETQILREELNRMKSELGQVRKLRSELSKPQEQKPTTPQSWAKMSPEEQAQLQELVDHAWQQKYGEKWTQFEQLQEQQQVYAQVQNVENLVKSFAGDLHKELDPIMGKLYDEFRAKADEGDDEATQILWEIKNTRSGAKYLVDLAKQEYGQKVEAKGDVAKANQAAAAKKAGVTLGSSPQVAPKQDFMRNLPKDPAKAAEMLKEELQRRGAM